VVDGIVLVTVDHARDLRHRLRVEAERNQLAHAAVLFDVAAQDRVEHGIRRQRVLVLLIRA
jgi:hypothetical protein